MSPERAKSDSENLAEANELLHHVWNHMHGQDMDGTRRLWPGDEGCQQNWNRLSDAIGKYLDPIDYQ